MKRSPSENEILNNLGPSKFSAEGFIGSDQRHPDEIIAADCNILRERNIEILDLVDKLKKAYTAAKAALGGDCEIRTGVTGTFFESRGRVPSPFRGEGTFEKGEAVVTEEKSGRKLIITLLSIHLIEKHSFFQGKGSRYRIDPVEAAEILDIGSVLDA